MARDDTETLDDIRHAVDVAIAKVEDQLVVLKRLRPLSIDEQARIVDVAHWLEDLGPDIRGR